jgi:hypothetical protein
VPVACSIIDEKDDAGKYLKLHCCVIADNKNCYKAEVVTPIDMGN